MQMFHAVFATVPDPRAENVRHDLTDILLIAFLAVLCGAQTCCEMSEFGHAKLRFLKRFLKLRHGVPSHDTFSTVLRMIDPKALDAAFGQLSADLVTKLQKGGVIAVDGKALAGAYDKGKASSPKMMVSAFAAGLRVTLATVAAKDGDEVSGALEVLGLVDLKGKIVTADALHCHRKMASLVTSKQGDYCLRLRGNQESLLSDARSELSKLKPNHPTVTTETRAHGRIETRKGVVVAVKGLAEHHDFPGLKAFGRIEETREIDGRLQTDTRIFALSRAFSTDAFMTAARAHWDIENGLHWSLDVAFGEDAARNRRDHGPANIAVLRRRALDVARAEGGKGSVARKLKRAGWEHEFLLKMLRHMR